MANEQQRARDDLERRRRAVVAALASTRKAPPRLSPEEERRRNILRYARNNGISPAQAAARFAETARDQARYGRNNIPAIVAARQARGERMPVDDETRRAEARSRRRGPQRAGPPAAGARRPGDFQLHEQKEDPLYLAEALGELGVKLRGGVRPDENPGLFITQSGMRRQLTQGEAEQVLRARYNERPQSWNPEPQSLPADFVNEAFGGRRVREIDALVGPRRPAIVVDPLGGFRSDPGDEAVYGQDDVHVAARRRAADRLRREDEARGRREDARGFVGNLGEIGGKYAENFPDRVRTAFWGTTSALLENDSFEMPLNQMLNRVDFIHDMRSRLADRTGRLARAYQERADANLPDVRRDSGWNTAYGVTTAVGDLVLAGAAAAATRNPEVGAAILGARAFGDTYTRSRSEGVSPERAFVHASLSAAAEAIPETAPVRRLLAPGTRALSRLGKPGEIAAHSIGGAMNQVVTEILRIGLDRGILDKEMSWGDALHRLRDAAVVGAIAHPVAHRLRQSAQRGAAIDQLDNSRLPAGDAYRAFSPDQGPLYVDPAPASRRAIVPRRNYELDEIGLGAGPLEVEYHDQEPGDGSGHGAVTPPAAGRPARLVATARERAAGVGTAEAASGARNIADGVSGLRPLEPASRTALGGRRAAGGMRALRPGARPATPPGLDDLVRTIIPMTSMTEAEGRDRDGKGRVVTSSKGARGKMQVMPETARDPGYGVLAARNNSLEETARVGRDLLAALTRRHGGDVSRAWAAYNWTPPRFTATARRYGDRWVEHVPQETLNYVQENLERLGRPAPDGGPTIPVSIPTLRHVDGPDNRPIYFVHGVSEQQRRTIEAALPAGKRLAPRRDGSFAVPAPYRDLVQERVNRIANPIMIDLGHEWERAMAEAELESR
jgi:hypothetical protein